MCQKTKTKTVQKPVKTAPSIAIGDDIAPPIEKDVSFRSNSLICVVFMNKKERSQKYAGEFKPLTLDSGINVGVRLLILGLFSSGYVLIKGGTFINFFISYII